MALGPVAAPSTLQIVLTLKKCTAGPPLLPSKIAGRKWQLAEGFCWRLAVYLTQLVDRLGIDMEVLDSFDGKPLAPYQAVVRREDWQNIRDRVAHVLVNQRRAYRRLFGGSGAPAIVEASEPRFSNGALETSTATIAITTSGIEKLVSNLSRSSSLLHGPEDCSHKEDCERSTASQVSDVSTLDLVECCPVSFGEAIKENMTPRHRYPLRVDRPFCAPIMLHNSRSYSLLCPLKLGRSATGTLQMSMA